MDHHQDIASTLNALLLNAKELQASDHDSLLSDQQKQLLDHLFDQWSLLSENDKTTLLRTDVETQMLKLAHENQAALRKVTSTLFPV